MRSLGPELRDGAYVREGDLGIVSFVPRVSRTVHRILSMDHMRRGAQTTPEGVRVCVWGLGDLELIHPPCPRWHTGRNGVVTAARSATTFPTVANRLYKCLLHRPAASLGLGAEGGGLVS